MEENFSDSFNSFSASNREIEKETEEFEGCLMLKEQRPSLNSILLVIPEKQKKFSLEVIVRW